jgi:hypothetical protein
MSFSVDDFQDLLRLLDQHPEWRAELRRQVLTEELLALPAEVREMAARSDERFTRIEATLDRLAAAQERTEARMEELAAALRSIDARTAEIVVVSNRLETRLGRTEGITLELRFAKNGPAYFFRLARRLRLVDTGVLADILDDAIDAGQIQDDDREEILNADLIFSGRRREDQADVYILAEVSSGIGPHDVERAADRSARLSKLGRHVIPVVVGFQINAEALELARERGVAQFLDRQSL